MAGGETILSFKDGEFTLKGKPLQIFSGAIHYFRIVPEYWHDRLLKAKACGLNTVETYVPWNLHEPQPGKFNNEGILDLRKFIQTAGNFDLNVIFRPGPYICSEWDFGGLPSWLLADPDMKVRSNYRGYQDAVERYFSWLLPQVLDLQISRGGPIIATQVENEYGSFSFDPTHLLWLRDLLWRSGVTELLVTSDNETCAKGQRALAEQAAASKVDLFNLPGVLPTANGMTVFEVSSVFTEIRREREEKDVSDSEAGLNTVPRCPSGVSNASRPLMVMELWSGWFDYWGATFHETTTASALLETVQYAFSRGASINLYMFHGGTNFGFMNGALQLPPEGDDSPPAVEAPADTESYPFRPDVTSYDYDAPLSEDGCVTGKYLALRQLIVETRKKKFGDGDVSSIPDVPSQNNRAQRPVIASVGIRRLAWNDVLSLVSKKTPEAGDPRWMESYSYENGGVQSYGYIVYRKTLSNQVGKNYLELTFSGRVRDRGSVLLNGATSGSVDWSQKDATVKLESKSISGNNANDGGDAGGLVLDLVVENLGRVNYTTSDNQARLNTQRKGINGPVLSNGAPLQGWDIIALDFEDGFLERAAASDSWSNNLEERKSPGLYRAVLHLEEEPKDYFLYLEGWHKGVAFVNGFNLGRYWEVGPTRSLYVPAPVLKKGDNQVLIFEEVLAGGQIVLGIEPRLS